MNKQKIFIMLLFVSLVGFCFEDNNKNKNKNFSVGALYLLASNSNCSLMGGSMQGSGCTLNLSGTVTSLTARFQETSGITTDGTNLFIADTLNHTINKVVISSGAATTLAGTAGTSGTTNGTGTSAQFFFMFPNAITTDGTNLYVADSGNHTIRKIVISSGVVTTLAGTAGSYGTTDETGTSAKFRFPTGITTDGTNLYVADTQNATIRKIVISSGVVTTLAGIASSSGTVDGTGTSAQFNQPSGITTDGTNVYVADTFNYTIRKVVISTGVVTTIAGTTGSSGTTDGTGTSAKFNRPYGITTDGTNLYVSDTFNYTIRKVVISTGAVTTLAGTTGTSGIASGTGTSAQFYKPFYLTTDGTSLYVTDYDRIRKIQ
ncbi:MAG: hypothetical protein H7A23_03400 [Leptospiraceae bacterium]|nr:hypothetical protein [Leptospiraceae bacterium]MCP5493575.1 hypothetical protein [Leptospiraceae bacterium]